MDDAKVRALLAVHEGRTPLMYYDTHGIPTVGIGHNLRDNPLSDRAIDVIFDDDLQKHIAELDKFLPWWREHDPVRQAALIDLMFNMGWTTLSQFKATLPAFQRKDYEAAARGLENSLWFRQVGVRGPRIVRMVRDGTWPPFI